MAECDSGHGTQELRVARNGGRPRRLRSIRSGVQQCQKSHDSFKTLVPQLLARPLEIGRAARGLVILVLRCILRKLPRSC